MQAIERTIISHFIASALDAGFTVHSVFDSEGRHLMKPTHAGTIAEALNVVGSVDSCRISFGRPDGPTAGREVLCIILGNGQDCIADMSEGRADWDALVRSEQEWLEFGGDVGALNVLATEQAEQLKVLRAEVAKLRAALASFGDRAA